MGEDGRTKGKGCLSVLEEMEREFLQHSKEQHREKKLEKETVQAGRQPTWWSSWFVSACRMQQLSPPLSFFIKAGVLICLRM